MVPDGEIVQSGPPEEAYRWPVDRFVAGFIGALRAEDAPLGAVVQMRPLTVVAPGIPSLMDYVRPATGPPPPSRIRERAGRAEW